MLLREPAIELKNRNFQNILIKATTSKPESCMMQTPKYQQKIPFDEHTKDETWQNNQQPCTLYKNRPIDCKWNKPGKSNNSEHLGKYRMSPKKKKLNNYKKKDWTYFSILTVYYWYNTVYFILTIYGKLWGFDLQW